MRNLILTMLLLTGIVAGGANDCENVAVEYQNENGGYLIFINPIAENGAWVLGDYAGHFINYVYDPEYNEMYYFDATRNVRMNTLHVVDEEYTEYFNSAGVGIWNLNSGEHPPFNLIRRA